MTLASILITVITGAVAGSLATLVIPRWGFGLVFNIVIGILGGVVGGWLLPKLGISLGGDILGAIITGTVGALAILAGGALVQRTGVLPRRRR